MESPHQVDMKNVVKCYKHFFGYFIALKTHGDEASEDVKISVARRLTENKIICSRNLYQLFWIGHFHVKKTKPTQQFRFHSSFVIGWKMCRKWILHSYAHDWEKLEVICFRFLFMLFNFLDFEKKFWKKYDKLFASHSCLNSTPDQKMGENCTCPNHSEGK